MASEPLKPLLVADPFPIRSLHPSFRSGVLELRQLWPESLVDEQALMDSDPRELALAVRALSTRLG